MGPYQKVNSDQDLTQKTVTAILEALSLPPEAVGPVTEAVASSYERTGVPYIDAEIAALPSRFGIEVTAHQGAEKEEFDYHSEDVSFVRHYIPSQMTRGTTVYRSARIRAGKKLSHTGSKRVGLSYTWEKADQGFLSGLLGSVVNARKSPVSFLPVSVTAGTEITIPIRIEVPAKKGHYTLTLYPSGAGGDVMRTSIEIVDHLETIPTGPSCGDYGEDHTAAIGVLEAFLTARGPSRILEVASGVNPHLLALAMAGHEVIAGDVCSNQMQVGSIFAQFHHSEGAKQRLGYIAFDAFNPPFQEEQFDGVAMFAALHHFPDPVMFLQRLATLVKPQGFVAVMSEPCDPSSLGEAYIRDLSAGINEQVFSVEEYREIFARAGLSEKIIRNDAGSLKAILIRH